MTTPKKYYKVWVDVDLEQPYGFDGEIHESDNDNSKMGDYAVFDTREKAEKFVAFVSEHRRFPKEDEL